MVSRSCRRGLAAFHLYAGVLYMKGEGVFKITKTFEHFMRPNSVLRVNMIGHIYQAGVIDPDEWDTRKPTCGRV